MSLAQVAFPPPTETGMEEWLFAHNLHHLAIIKAMKQVRDIQLPERQIYPVNVNDPASVAVFLREHQSLHNDFGAILGIQGNDIANVDFSQEKQREAWFFLNLVGHRAAAEALGLGI